MKNIKFKIFFLFFAGFLQISNNFVFGMEHYEDQKCSLCLASTYYVTDDEVNLINKRKEEIPANTEGLRIGSEEDIVPVDSRFKILVDKSDRSKLIPLPSSEIVKISHVDNDYKHYFHTTCFQKYIASSRYKYPNESLICPTCYKTIQTAITLDKVKIYPETTLEYKTLWETQTSNVWNLGYKINKIEGFSQFKTHILFLEQQITVSQLVLDIDSSIHEIPESFFSELETLEIQKLYICNNNLTSLPTSIGELTSLKELWLYSNNLTSLPTSIGELTSLKELWLYSNNLTSLPTSIGQLTSLETLSLWNNKLTSLPESIGNLRSLKTLDSALNKLTSLPESIGQLSNLKELYLWNNKLTSLPTSIGSLSSLEKLYLWKNKLTSLPESIGQLSNLKKLDLYRNSLTFLPESIGQLSNLQKLNLIGNKLSSLPESIVNLSSLEQLWIHFNHLIPWPNETLKHFSSDGYLIVTKSTQTLTKRQIQDWLRRKRRVRRRYQQIGHHQL